MEPVHGWSTKVIRPFSNPKNEEYVVVDPPVESYTGTSINLKSLPMVSFCIPTLNNQRTLEKCLQSIVNQDYPRIEIVIVDGGSTDRTLEIAKRYTDKVFHDPGRLGSARQMSVEKSSGKVLALFDSDIIIPHTKWLVNAVNRFNYSNRVSTVMSANESPPGSSLTNRLFFNHWILIVEDRATRKHGLLGFGNSLVLRECIEGIGGINTSLHWGEDFDWARKLWIKGYQVVYTRDAIFHDTMRSLGQFARKQLIGAETFTVHGFQLMNLTPWDAFQEQFILGTKGMFRGLVRDGDRSWLLFPLYITIRVVAYCRTYMRTRMSRGENY